MATPKHQEVTDRIPEEIQGDENRGKLLLWTYVALVIGLVAVYLILHRFMPAEIQRPVGLEANIARAKLVISSNRVDTSKIATQLPSAEALGITGTPAAQFVEAIKKIQAEASKEQKAQLEAELATMKAEIPKTEGLAVDRVTKLIVRIEEESKKDQPDPAVLKVYLDDLEGESTKTGGRNFWSTGWLKWLELFFWAGLGTLVYALWEIQRWLRREPVGEFRKATSWYISTTIRGPFVALFIIFALSTIKLDVVNIGVDLSKVPIVGWIFLAGTLGLFSRMAYEQLSIIVKAIFPKAWAAADVDMRPSIVPTTANVAFGNTLPFDVDPKRPVGWDIWPEDLGSIDASGKYTAPKKGEPSGATVGAQVVVRATLKDDPSIVDTAKVTLYEQFGVKGDMEVPLGTEHVYKAEPEQEGGITWSIDPPLGQIAPDGRYKAPKEGQPPEAVSGTEVMIQATRTKEPKVSSSLKIRLVKGS